MTILSPGARKLSFAVVAAGLILTGCTDNDYDMNEVDYTIGVGGGELTLPTSSTDIIRLADVFDIDDTECVVIDPVTKDYIFRQDGGDVEPAKPFIDEIKVTQDKLVNKTVEFDLPSGARGMLRAGAMSFTAEGELALFEYSGEKSHDVRELLHATSDAEFTLEITFSQDLQKYVPVLDQMSVYLPEYIVLSDLSVSRDYTVSGSALAFANVDPKKNITVRGRVRELDFTAEDKLGLGHLEQTAGGVALDGSLRVKASFSELSPEYRGGGHFAISSVMDLEDMLITSVTGRFAPVIELDDLGDAEITSVPDFLTGDNVVIDLANPQIWLTIQSDMDVRGIIDGVITAYKDNRKTAEISIEGLVINAAADVAGGVSRICICRDKSALEQQAGVAYYEVANLSDLVRVIPDRMAFSAEARADETRMSTFEFGRHYSIRPSYTIEAPLAFGADARISYDDVIDGWNDDVKDLELDDNSYVEITTNVENRVPFYLTLKASAVGVDGKPLDKSLVEVEVDETILASTDGVTSQYTPVKIRVKQNKKGALKQLDGISLSFEGDASSDKGASAVGVVLNSENHFVVAKDIVVKLVGKVIVDLN